MNDSLGDRIKSYEQMDRLLYKIIPTIARVDGINFSSFTKGLAKPYDKRLTDLMIEVTLFLAKEFNANCAYTQSDEISLGWYFEDINTELYGGYRVQKLNSHLASKTTVRFNKLLSKFIPEKADKEPCFDSRVYNVPNLAEAANNFLWREQDATRNSIESAARCYYSHKECHKKNCNELQEMLFLKGINWNEYPNFFKRGTFIVKRKVNLPFTAEELDSLPEKHEARKNPDLIIERNLWKVYTKLPKFSTIKNREEFLFLGEEYK